MNNDDLKQSIKLMNLTNRLIKQRQRHRQIASEKSSDKKNHHQVARRAPNGFSSIVPPPKRLGQKLTRVAQTRRIRARWLPKTKPKQAEFYYQVIESRWQGRRRVESLFQGNSFLATVIIKKQKPIPFPRRIFIHVSFKSSAQSRSRR